MWEFPHRIIIRRVLNIKRAHLLNMQRPVFDHLKTKYFDHKISGRRHKWNNFTFIYQLNRSNGFIMCFYNRPNLILLFHWLIKFHQLIIIYFWVQGCDLGVVLLDKGFFMLLIFSFCILLEICQSQWNEISYFSGFVLSFDNWFDMKLGEILVWIITCIYDVDAVGVQNGLWINFLILLKSEWNETLSIHLITIWSDPAHWIELNFLPLDHLVKRWDWCQLIVHFG